MKPMRSPQGQESDATQLGRYHRLGACCPGASGGIDAGPCRPTQRRGFLRGAGVALGSAAGLSLLQGCMAGQPSAALAPALSAPHRIDIHHHFAPPAWIAEVRNRELLQRANAEWTPQRSLEDMDQAGVASAMLSITNPGLWFGDHDTTRRLVRACNEYGAALVQRHPTRFGLFAALPLPDADASLREIAHAYDVLKADGLHLFTSYGDKWLGDPAFEPVMAEMNRRKAVVHVHPTAANCCKNLVPDVSPGIMEYGTDTTRAMLGVLFSGTAARYPDIRFIWSHAGGTAPFLMARIERGALALKDHARRMPKGVVHEMRKFHYDLAGATHRAAISSLAQLVGTSQVLFGTDFPPAGPSIEVVKSLAGLGYGAADLRRIERDNALALLPRLRA